MTGQQGEGRVAVAVRDRNARVGGGGNGGGDAGHDDVRHAGGPQGFAFLAAAAEDERIAALEPNDTPAGLGFFNEQRLDLGLRHRVVLGPLARVDPPAVVAAVAEQHRIRQCVVDDRVARGEQFPAADGEETRVAGAGTDERHRARREQVAGNLSRRGFGHFREE